MKIARVFKSGNSQAVRLPRDFNLDVAKVSGILERWRCGLATIEKELAG